jgi:hypothetical protein
LSQIGGRDPRKDGMNVLLLLGTLIEISA